MTGALSHRQTQINTLPQYQSGLWDTASHKSSEGLPAPAQEVPLSTSPVPDTIVYSMPLFRDKPPAPSGA